MAISKMVRVRQKRKNLTSYQIGSEHFGKTSYHIPSFLPSPNSGELKDVCRAEQQQQFLHYVIYSSSTHSLLTTSAGLTLLL